MKYQGFFNAVAVVRASAFVALSGFGGLLVAPAAQAEELLAGSQLSVATSAPVQATAAVRAVEPSRLKVISQQRQWAHLLHYRYHPFSMRWRSQNDSEAFFVSPDALAMQGPEQLLEELTAEVEAFQQTRWTDVDESAQCRFPARYYWVKKQLPDIEWQDLACPDFEEWAGKLDAHSLTLIFPASHINSPSSMYGHTLIRMDREDPNSSKLLAFSVNFAANADPDDNELVFSAKGLAGGYPGVATVMRYHEKTREYQHMEYRNVWEYPLNLQGDEVDQFVRHIWEVQGTEFDYYFFDENCSYRVLAFIDAASERSDAARHFDFTAIPVDTIRELEHEQLLGKAEFRPSAATLMSHMIENTTDDVVGRAVELVDTSIDPQTDFNALLEQQLAGLNALEQAQMLELAYQYARYAAIKKKQNGKAIRNATLGILAARSKLGGIEPYPPLETAPPRDDEGHGSRRISFTAGSVGVDNNSVAHGFGGLSFRPAYHDLVDPSYGFVPGSQIVMGKTDLRWAEGDSIRLEHFTAVNVRSLSARDALFRPTSWEVDAGFERRLQEQKLGGYLDVGFGRTWKTAFGRPWALAKTTLDWGGFSGVNWGLAVGPELGWYYQGDELQTRIMARWQPSLMGRDVSKRVVEGEFAWSPNVEWQLRLILARELEDIEGAGSYSQNTMSLNSNWYF